MFTSKHNPNGTSPHFDNARLESLIASYQAGANPTAALTEIVELTQRRALTLIRFNGTKKYVPEDELLSDVHSKLLRSVSRFDPARGSAFTYLSCLIQNTLRSSVTNARKNASRFVELDAISDSLSINGEQESQDVVDDLIHRIKTTVKTTLTDEAELSAARWYIESFCTDGFQSPRNNCANVAMAVFRLAPDRSREIFDIVMLETRRILYDFLPARSPIVPGRLYGTRCAWMTQYRPLLSESEFTKFAVLMKGLSPFLLMLISPESRSRRQDRNPPIVRQNLLWILHGHPDAKPLFTL
jgi:hypothetical protein